MDSIIDSRIKTPDVGVPLFQTESKVMTVEHDSSTEYNKYYGPNFRALNG